MRRSLCFIFTLFALTSAVLTLSAQEHSRAANPSPQQPVVDVAMPEVVADVGGERILKSQLAEEAFRQFGEEMLKDEIKRQLILLECKKRNIEITQEEIEAEIARLSQTFGFSTDKWLEMLERERGLSRENYVSDIVVPLMGITKLAGQELVVSPEEIQREFDSRFGPSVQVRQIVLSSKAEAERTRAEVLANPDSFESVAKNLSIDQTSKPYGGLLPPIRRHVYKAKIVEDTAFSLKPGEISNVFEWPEGFFVIFRCEQEFPAQSVDIAAVQAQLTQKVRDGKVREVSEKVFENLMKNAKIDAVMADPVRSQQYPNIAAIINEHTITRDYLAERCISRHGKEVLQGMIGKLLIEQECRKLNVTVSPADIDNEIREMALKHMSLMPDGTPNSQGWLAQAVEQARVTPEIFRANTIWPMLAMKKIVRLRPEVQVTQEDAQKGFEANYGPRVRCLAIFLDSQRIAQTVWTKATQMPTEENFKELAEKYSVDQSRLVQGVIPAIQNYSGHPDVEKEAFRLKPGEISSLIREGSAFVILYCLGQTEAEKVVLADVQAEIVADIYEKKINMAVGMLYEQLLATVRVENYLEGTITGPISAAEAAAPETRK